MGRGVTEEVYRTWHALLQLYCRSPLNTGSFVQLLCVAVWHSWQHTLGSDVAYADIYERDRCQCSSRCVSTAALPRITYGFGPKAATILSQTSRRGAYGAISKAFTVVASSLAARPPRILTGSWAGSLCWKCAGESARCRSNDLRWGLLGFDLINREPVE
jgi:hypothetical protein